MKLNAFYEGHLLTLSIAILVKLSMIVLDSIGLDLKISFNHITFTFKET